MLLHTERAIRHRDWAKGVGRVERPLLEVEVQGALHVGARLVRRWRTGEVAIRGGERLTARLDGSGGARPSC
jgi:hypothetical protein